MKTGCLTKSFLKIDAGGGVLTYIAVGLLSVYLVWCNDKKLWSGGYNISGSKLNLWNNSLKKNLNAPRPSEHPPVWGEKCQNV